MSKPGGRHYSDRLCSDRRYSNNPQSGPPSTSLAHLGICRNSRNWEKIGRGWRCRMYGKHVIDPGIEMTEGSAAWGVGGYSGEVRGAPSSGKVTTYLQGSNTIVLPSTPDFWDLDQCISNRYCPQPPDVDVPTVECRSNLCWYRVCRNNVVYPSKPAQFHPINHQADWSLL